MSLSPTGFGGGPGFGGVGTGGSSFAFSSTSKPTGGSLSAGTIHAVYSTLTPGPPNTMAIKNKGSAR